MVLSIKLFLEIISLTLEIIFLTLNIAVLVKNNFLKPKKHKKSSLELLFLCTIYNVQFTMYKGVLGFGTRF